MPHSVYALDDPRTDQPFYVGMSSHPEQRYYEHMADTADSPKVARIQDIRGAGLAPALRVIETHESREIASNRERHWIQRYLNDGVKLTNVSRPLAFFSLDKANPWLDPVEELHIRWSIYQPPRDRELTKEDVRKFLRSLPRSLEIDDLNRELFTIFAVGYGR